MAELTGGGSPLASIVDGSSTAARVKVGESVGGGRPVHQLPADADAAAVIAPRRIDQAKLKAKK